LGAYPCTHGVTDGDVKCEGATISIPYLILPIEVHEFLINKDHGAASDLIYDRLLPETPSPDPTTFNARNAASSS